MSQMTQIQRAEVRGYMVFGASMLLSFHVRETLGPNHGEIVDALLHLAGGQPPDSWCAAFCDVLYDAACHVAEVAHDFDIGLNVSGVVRRADALGRYFEDHTKAKEGDLYVRKGGSTGYEHMGLVVKPFNPVTGQFWTIEGNTNDDGSSNGNGIYRKAHDPGPNIGFIEM